MLTDSRFSRLVPPASPGILIRTPHVRHAVCFRVRRCRVPAPAGCRPGPLLRLGSGSATEAQVLCLQWPRLRDKDGWPVGWSLALSLGPSPMLSAPRQGQGHLCTAVPVLLEDWPALGGSKRPQAKGHQSHDRSERYRFLFPGQATQMPPRQPGAGPSWSVGRPGAPHLLRHAVPTAVSGCPEGVGQGSHCKEMRSPHPPCGAAGPPGQCPSPTRGGPRQRAWAPAREAAQHIWRGWWWAGWAPEDPTPPCSPLSPQDPRRGLYRLNFVANCHWAWQVTPGSCVQMNLPQTFEDTVRALLSRQLEPQDPAPWHPDPFSKGLSWRGLCLEPPALHRCPASELQPTLSPRLGCMVPGSRGPSVLSAITLPAGGPCTAGLGFSCCVSVSPKGRGGSGEAHGQRPRVKAAMM